MGIIYRSKAGVSLAVFVIGLLAVIGVVVVNSLTAHASEFTSWSWTQAPNIFESQTVSDIADTVYCPTAYESHRVVGLSAPQQICLKSGDDVKLGYYSDGRNFLPVVGFPHDDTFYPIYGSPCQYYDSCLYLPESDTLVTKQFLINPYVRSLVVYKNFTKRLTRFVDLSNLASYYTFDSSNADYTFQNSSGYQWPIGGFGASNNGKWLAVEFRQRGVGLLNIETLQMRRISPQSFGYGFGRDPATEFAVTNDGEHIILTGKNSSLISYDVTPNCGDDASDESMGPILNSNHPCSFAYIDAGIDRFYYGTHPVFSDDGGELRLYATSYSVAPQEIVLRAAGYGVKRLDYLALGDSFTSGEGETDDSYYQPNTNDEFEKCHLSTRSYPYLVAKDLGIDNKNVRSVACSGATMGDVVGADKDYWGQHDRLRGIDLSLNPTIKTLYATSARDSLIPGRIHQLSFVEYYKPKVITVGIGGNDVGFMEKLRSCVGLDSCEWADTSEGREKTALEVQGAFDKLVNTYSAIHEASPDSRIYVIGYPKVIDPDGQCGLLDGILLNSSERTFMNEGILYINQVIAAAAKKAGIKYVDVENSLGDHVLCGSGNPVEMNAITLGDDDAPSQSVNWLKVIGQESFHPRPAAHADIASTIIQSVPDITTYNYCNTELLQDKMVCPIDSAKAPTPSSYWLADGNTHNYDSQSLGDFVNDSPTASDGRQKAITLGSYNFAPNSVVRAEIHSNPVVLGTTTSDDNGAVSFNIELPADLSEGYHTVHLYGTGYSGKKVDLYQVIKYMLPAVPETQIEVVSGSGSISQAASVSTNSQPVIVTDTAPTTVESTPSRDDKSLVTRGGNKEVASTTNATSIDLDKSDNKATGNFLDLLVPGVTLLFIGMTLVLYLRTQRGR